MRKLDEKWIYRRYETENIPIQKSLQSASSNKEDSNSNDNKLCKRRRNALIFEQENYVIVL